MNETSILWDSALVKIGESVGQANFSTWFKDTSIVKIEDGTVFLGVPNSFTQEWLQKKFHNAILRILRQMNEHLVALEYVTMNYVETQSVPIGMTMSDFLMKRFEKVHGSIASVGGKVGLLDTRVINVCSKVENLAIQIEDLRKELFQELRK